MSTKYYEDEKTGTAFFFDDAGELMAAPMQTNNTPDWHCAGYVCDFDELLGSAELCRITLATFEATK